MDPFSFPPFAAVLDAAYSAVDALSSVLAPFAGGSSVSFAIVLVTLTVRVALLPLGVAAARSDAAMRRIQPKLTALRTRFAKNPERLQRELADLFRRERVSPLGSIVPLLAQLPVVGVVYAVFTRPSIAGHANDLLSQSIAELPLAKSLAGLAAGGGMTITGLVAAGAAAMLLMLVAELGRRWSARIARARGGVQPPRVLGFLSYFLVVGAVLVPVAAAIYMAVSAVWGLAERMVLARRFSPPPAALPA